MFALRIVRNTIVCVAMCSAICQLQCFNGLCPRSSSRCSYWPSFPIDLCADCRTRNPRWSSFNLGIFLCVNCASIHRKMGTHISKVKSLTLDSWTKEQVEHMRQIGNIKSNQLFNPDEVRNPPPTNMVDSERDSELEKFIRDKYEYKRFQSRSASVAALLGPSRSAASMGSSLPGSSAPPTSSLSTSQVSQPNRSQTAPLAAPGTQSSMPSRSPQPPPVRASTVSVPPVQPQLQPQQPQQPQQPAGGVWGDIAALQSGPSIGGVQNSTLPLQYIPPQSQPMSIPSSTNPFPTQNGSYLGAGGGLGGTSISPGMGMGSGMPNGLGTSPFQPQMQMPQQTGFMTSPPSFPSGVGNPFAQMAAQPQQMQQSFGSMPSSFTNTSSPFNPSPSPFAPSQTQSAPFNPQQQTPSYMSQPAANPFSQMNGAGGSMQMHQNVPQMSFNASPSPFGGMNQMGGLSSPPPFQQQQVQQQPMFGAPQGQANGAGGGQNPFTSWVKAPPSQGYPGSAQTGPWGSM
ncbi:ArfGap-domain-containing protein [Stereum hirsutum FP-91666 SS1]|uniref:ArfGap-domain-containing protein n=1 Tax=Stereum hirsutum (strain FP-91666) TaxID=721885 RepID=UPI000440E201|nr:ArfGap-domain-containing protein [Stereum hirsutum FP-91666 SS1]EIM87598.1 ArfGap-domain-containing protein [Stereum hirsutum FP-91666 SS1]